eukprot:356864-Chlamydomonas_euryale.AAC.1
MVVVCVGVGQEAQGAAGAKRVSTSTCPRTSSTRAALLCPAARTSGTSPAPHSNVCPPARPNARTTHIDGIQRHCQRVGQHRRQHHWQRGVDLRRQLCERRAQRRPGAVRKRRRRVDQHDAVDEIASLSECECQQPTKRLAEQVDRAGWRDARRGFLEEALQRKEGRCMLVHARAAAARA